MPKLVTNNRKNNLAKIEELCLYRLKKEGITQSLLGKLIGALYSDSPWFRSRNSKSRKTRKKIIDNIGSSLLLLCIKHKIPTKAGFVYAITNDAFPDCVKLGHTKDCEDRLLRYQTYSPYRDYKVVWQQFSLNAYDMEQKLLSAFDRTTPNGEWVLLPTDNTLELKQLLNKSFKSLS